MKGIVVAVLNGISKDCGAKVVLAADQRIYDTVSGFVSELEKLEHVVLLRGSLNEGHTYDSLIASGKANPVASIKPDSEASFGMIYTSGTTGNPKGVVLSHKNMLRTMERGTKAQEFGVPILSEDDFQKMIHIN